MNKKIILGITVASVISIGALSGCGNTTDNAPKNEKENSVATENVSEEEPPVFADDSNEVENTDEVETTEERPFGLQDYEGLYCYTATEEIEDYEVTYTYGYLLNGDGTGVSYIQDVIDFTWNETEIHYGDRTESYVMEPGKLTVGGIVYNKIAGNFITPNPCDVDKNNIENGIYHAYMDKNGLNETDDGLTIYTEILTEDSYDIVDIHNMAAGDVIYIKGVLLPVNSIDHTDSGIININGGVENNGSALIAVDDSNCFVYAGMDMERSYTSHGMTELTVSDDVKFIDNSEPQEVVEYTGNEAISALKEMLDKYPLNCYNCSIMVENGEIVEINRIYVP